VVLRLASDPKDFLVKRHSYHKVFGQVSDPKVLLAKCLSFHVVFGQASDPKVLPPGSGVTALKLFSGRQMNRNHRWKAKTEKALRHVRKDG
jgi:hypothetical protein